MTTRTDSFFGKPLFNTDGLDLPPIPDGIDEPYHPYELDLSGWVCVVSDLHFPFHNRKLLEYQIETAKRMNVSGFIIDGDMFDFHTLSRFDKYANPPKLDSEIDIGLAYTRYLRDQVGKDCFIGFIEGNHDQRWEKSILEKMKEFKDIKGIKLPAVCELDQTGITFINEKRGIRMRDLIVLHGHEFDSRSIPQSPAKSVLSKANANVLIGHHHTTDSFRETVVFGKPIQSWVIGCSSNLAPSWCRNNRWNHGFAMVELPSSGGFRVHNLKIEDGQIM